MKENTTNFYPEFGFWKIKVKITEINEKGKLKKRSEIYLVDASNVTEAENKTKSEMNEFGYDYTIESITKTSFIAVI